MMRYSVIPVGGGFWLGENKMYVYGKKIGGWFISFWLVSLYLFGGLKEGENKKSRRGGKEVTGGGFWGKLTGVNNIHSTHCTSSIIENPFFLKIEMGFDRVDSGELRDDIRDNGLRIIAILVNGTEGNLV